MDRRAFLQLAIAAALAPSVPLPSPTAPSFVSMTLVDAVKANHGFYARAVAATLTETNAILNDLPWEAPWPNLPWERI
jgi:predicted dienelactone hydrolase